MQTSEGRIDLVEIRRARQQAQRERAQQLRARITERRRRERLKYVIENIRQFMPTDIHPTELDRATGPDVIDWQRLGLLGNIQPAYDRIENFLLHSGRLDKYYEWVENKIKEEEEEEERRRRERLKYVIENIRQFMPTDIHPTELDRATGPDVIDWQRLGLLGNIQPAYDRIENFLLHSGRLDKYYEWVENKIKGGKIRKSKKRKKQRKSKKRKKQRKSKKRKKYKKNK